MPAAVMQYVQHEHEGQEEYESGEEAEYIEGEYSEGEEHDEQIEGEEYEEGLDEEHMDEELEGEIADGACLHWRPGAVHDAWHAHAWPWGATAGRVATLASLVGWS